MSLPPAPKVILITGASSGFGRACSEYLGKKGHKVYGTSRKPGTRINPGKMIQMDVNDDNSVKMGIDHIIEKEGRLDVVVNNAGIGVAGSIEQTSTEEIKIQFETNFFGIFRVCNAVLPIMRAQKSGCIINVSSIAGIVSTPFQGAYSASKFAVEGLTEALRMEVKPFGINVVLIEPGDFNTGFTDNRIKTEQSRTDSIYSKRFERALHVMEEDEKNGPQPIKIAVLVDSIINNPSPRLRYMAGPMLERFSVYLRKFIPSKLFEWIIMKNFRI